MISKVIGLEFRMRDNNGRMREVALLPLDIPLEGFGGHSIGAGIDWEVTVHASGGDDTLRSYHFNYGDGVRK